MPDRTMYGPLHRYPLCARSLLPAHHEVRRVQRPRPTFPRWISTKPAGSQTEYRHVGGSAAKWPLAAARRRGTPNTTY